MKHILTTLCILALVITESTTVLAAEDADTPCYYPISVEEYTYGSFDEPRVNKTYLLSLSDDPNLIPMEDFERGGRRYFLLDFTREGSNSECGVVTYTVIFGSKKLPVGVKTLGGTRAAAKAEAYADPVELRSMLIVGVVMLVLAAAATLESKMQSHDPVEADDKADWFSDLG